MIHPKRSGEYKAKNGMRGQKFYIENMSGRLVALNNGHYDNIPLVLFLDVDDLPGSGDSLTILAVFDLSRLEMESC
jgi:hypothetical protein